MVGRVTEGSSTAMAEVKGVAGSGCYIGEERRARCSLFLLREAFARLAPLPSPSGRMSWTVTGTFQAEQPGSLQY